MHSEFTLMRKEYESKVNWNELIDLRDTILDSIARKTIDDKPFKELLDYVWVEMSWIMKGKENPYLMIKWGVDALY